MRVIPGLNVQWPWSELIISGHKKIETRGYPIPKKYIGVELALIETPGKMGLKDAGIAKARIIGTVTFGRSLQYESKLQWLADYEKHRVNSNDALFKWRGDRRKYGWTIASVMRLTKPVPAPEKRGIVFATACQIPT